MDTQGKIDKIMRDRWNEATRLITSAHELMCRCLDWPYEQDEPFESVTDDMETWIKEARQHVHNLETDLVDLEKLKNERDR